MECIEDLSYGVIPVHQAATGYQVLLIEQIGRRGDVFWSFPGGHPEAGETPVATAGRELTEETGLVAGIDESKVYRSEYTFTHEGKQYAKTYDYFLGWVVDQTTTITQPHEVASLRWCSLKEARQLLTHENTKKILATVSDMLKV